MGMSENFDFTIILEPQAEEGFTVSVPALPEVVTEGDSEAEAIAMAEEAIRAILAYRRDRGIPIPGDAELQLRKITVAEAPMDRLPRVRPWAVARN
jgi:antitoxin HicB